MKNVHKKKGGQKTKAENLGKRLAKVEERTISQQKTAKAVNSFAKSTNSTPMPTSFHPHSMLTFEEAEYHDAMRGGEARPESLLNDNIEPSLHRQLYRSDYEYTSTVPAEGTLQCTVMSATNSSPDSDTPKAFGAEPLANVGAVGGFGYPGPASAADNSIKAAALLAHTESIHVMRLETDGGSPYANIVNPTRPCPFYVPGSIVDQGTILRWQLTKINIKVINRTVGAKRGGLLYIIQPTNRPLDLVGTSPKPIDFAQRGIFKAYDDCETKGPTTNDGWVTLSVRDGLNAYHCAGAGPAGTDTTNSLAGAAAYIVTEGPSEPQDVTIMVKLFWCLAGSAVRGIAEPHSISREQSDRAAHANSVMRNANIVPSEQKGKQHLPAAIALSDSASLQAMVAPRQATTLDKVGAAIHPAVKVFKHFAGKHIKSLVNAGMAGLAKRAMAAI